MSLLYLVRHGQASFGQQDYDRLSILGERQAFITGEWLTGASFKVAGCGSLLRQQQTLAGILAGMGSSANTETFPSLNELNVDDLILTANPQYTDRTGLNTAILAMANPAHAFFTTYRSALQRWCSGKYDSEYQESWHDFKTRTFHTVEQVAKGLEGESALLVSSGGVISAIVLGLLNCPVSELFNINRQIHNGSITTIAVGRNKLRLHTFNNYAHLQNEPQLLTRI